MQKNTRFQTRVLTSSLKCLKERTMSYTKDFYRWNKSIWNLRRVFVEIKNTMIKQPFSTLKSNLATFTILEFLDKSFTFDILQKSCHQSRSYFFRQIKILDSQLKHTTCVPTL